MKRIAVIAGILTVGLLAAPRTGGADEGMFLLHEADKLPLPALKKRGLALSVAGLKRLAPAIAQLARGGTGSFVSAEGLIVTNHHVAYGCLARLDATTHRGIMDRGHVASSRQTEIPCPAYDMLAVLDVREVTRQVLSAVKPGMKPPQRFKAVLVQKRKLEAACEKRGDRICQVRELNDGAGFTLSAYKRIRDVRLVYAPPKDLGKYGGDIDNWRYPRHTADFTFLRAYVTPAGKGAPFKAANVPYRPKNHLKVSTAGVRRGMFNMVLGFPGRTMRHATHARAKFHSDYQMAKKARLFGTLLKALPQKGLSGRRYQGLDSGLNNAKKYYEDSIKQFTHFQLLAKKKRQMAAIAARIAASPALSKKHGRLLARMETIYRSLRNHADKSRMLGYLPRLVKSLGVATDLVRWSQKRRIKDIEREGERYRDKNMYMVYRDSDTLEKRTTLEGEKALLTAMLLVAAELPKNQRLRAVDWLWKLGKAKLRLLKRRSKGSQARFAELYAKQTRGAAPKTRALAVAVDYVFAGTKIYALDVTDAKAVKLAKGLRTKLWKADARRLRRSKDLLLQLAVRLSQESDRLRKGPLMPYEKILAPILRPQLVRDVIQPPYWDANFTLRLSYGTVRDYTESKTQKRWRYLSRLTWLVNKGRGKYPFLVPPKLRRVFAAKDFGRWVDPVIKDVPVNFTTTLDTTGGNSGSPVLNGKGELIGLLFDGTPESILSDWQYNEQAQRSICVDIRFALFLAEKVDRASYVLRELGLGK